MAKIIFIAFLTFTLLMPVTLYFQGRLQHLNPGEQALLNESNVDSETVDRLVREELKRRGEPTHFFFGLLPMRNTNTEMLRAHILHQLKETAASQLQSPE